MDRNEWELLSMKKEIMKNGKKKNFSITLSSNFL